MSSSASTKKVQQPAVDFSQTAAVGQTKWLRLETLTYADQTGKVRKWDRAVRSTRVAEDSTDAVVVLATLRNGANAASPTGTGTAAGDSPKRRKQDCEQILLVKQFRPALNAYTLELPAGLVDKGETPGAAALRELKEECGYIGKLVSVTARGLPVSPGLTNGNVALAVVDVDLSLEENRVSVQQLDEGEFCEVLKVSKRGLLAELEKLERDAKAQGEELHVVFALWSLAVGMAAGASML
eukprot:TRINITY_DN59616_c0_g1_i2.p1 TRINITY_DN59616_c0_g1~~TRINITY_DN59616_c0_g1_i2.p1  ORF type:complete len:240 (+),score=40.04 TRINITY_DN59616_c0_g1_i2:68-787(+)